ncbi:hypothetical protein PvNV_094 [Penaeus vannamei nudivirus]|nr:hypothetical protein PvSNPV_094 [Penaeus vannamei nucleopolyhedrovirus]
MANINDLLKMANINVHILFDSTSGMTKLIPMIHKTINSVFVMRTVFPNLKVSLVTFKDSNFYNNGVMSAFEIDSLEDVQEFMDKISTFSNDSEFYKSGLTGLLTALDVVEKNHTIGDCNLFYMITSGGINYNHPDLQELKFGNVDEEMQSSSINVFQYRQYHITSIINRLRNINAKLSICSPLVADCYNYLNMFANASYTIRPLIEILKFVNFEDVMIFVCEDVAINYLHDNTNEDLAIFGTMLRRYEDLKRLKYNLKDNTIHNTQAVYKRKTSTKTAELLVGGRLIKGFLHFPMTVESFKNSELLANAQISSIRTDDSVEHFAAIPMVKEFITKIFNDYGTREDKCWFEAKMLTFIPSNANFDDAIYNHGVNHMTDIKENAETTKGFFILQKPVKSWSEMFTHEDFFNIKRNDILEWLMSRFIPNIKYINAEDKPFGESIFTADGLVKYLPAHYKYAWFDVFNKLPLLVDHYAFSEYGTFSSAVFGAAVLKCSSILGEDVMCKVLLSMVKLYLKDTTFDSNIEVDKWQTLSGLSKPFIQQLFLDVSVRPFLHENLKNLIVKSLHMCNLFKQLKINKYMRKNVVAYLEVTKDYKTCKICTCKKDVRYFEEGNDLCISCSSMIYNSEENKTAKNVKSIIVFDLDNSLDYMEVCKVKHSLGSMISDLKSLRNTYLIKLECSKCQLLYAVYNIESVSKRYTGHKCPRCRILKTEDAKAIIGFNLYTLYLKNNSDVKFTKQEHLSNLEFIKFHADKIKDIDKKVEMFNNCNINSMKMDVYYDILELMPMIATSQERGVELVEWQELKVMNSIDKDLMKKAILLEFEQPLVGLNSFWNKENPKFPAVAKKMLNFKRVYSDKEIEKVLNGEFVTKEETLKLLGVQNSKMLKLTV